MSSHRDPNEKLIELLSGKVLGDLSNDEQIEVEKLSDSHADTVFELERAAAALQLVFDKDRDGASPDDSLPNALRGRILKQWQEMPSAEVRTISPQKHSEQYEPTVGDSRAGQFNYWSTREAIAWLAFAATLLLALRLWLVNGPADSGTKSATSARVALLKEAPDLIRIDWSDGKTPFQSKVKGDVVWSNSRQEGYMRFVGMPQNIPTREQYQLWIIDPARDDEPIDGGVFDVVAGEEVIVAIDAKLRVVKPAAFAITVEQPGGVVVSTQERLPLIAKVVN